MAPSRRAHELGHGISITVAIPFYHYLVHALADIHAGGLPDADAHPDTDAHSNSDTSHLPVSGSISLPVAGHPFVQRARVGCSAGIP